MTRPSCLAAARTDRDRRADSCTLKGEIQDVSLLISPTSTLTFTGTGHSISYQYVHPTRYTPLRATEIHPQATSILQAIVKHVMQDPAMFADTTNLRMRQVISAAGPYR